MSADGNDRIVDASASALRAAARPVETLFDLVGEAKVVLVGEATHGTRCSTLATSRSICASRAPAPQSSANACNAQSA